MAHTVAICTADPRTATPAQPTSGPAIDPGERLLFIINAASGRHDPEVTRADIEGALQAAGRTAELRFTNPVDLARVAREGAVAAFARRSAVVAVGGDGTINAVARAAHAQGCAMGVVPQGTFNYFARTHDLPTETGEATAALLDAAPVPVQVGLVNDQLFLVNASLGLYPELLQDREAYKARFGRSRLVAFVSALITLLGSHRQLRLRIEHGSVTRSVNTPTLFVGNNRLQLEQVGLREAPDLDAGRIAAVMLRPIGALAMLGLVWRGAMGTLGEADSVESFEFQRMVVRTRRALHRRGVKVAVDGEVGWMHPPLVFQVSDRALYLLKPQAAAGAEPGGATGTAA
jgi:diacylglycerol kinase family enzyme